MKNLCIAGFLFLFLVGFAPKAEAKIIFYGYGTSVMKVKDPSPATKKRMVLISRSLRARTGRVIPSDYKIGYKYKYFSLMFMNMWTWKGSFVLYRGRRYISLNKKFAKIYKIDLNSLKKPFGYRFPTGLIVLLVVVAGFIALALLGGGDDDTSDDEEAERLLEQSRAE